MSDATDAARGDIGGAHALGGADGMGALLKDAALAGPRLAPVDRTAVGDAAGAFLDGTLERYGRPLNAFFTFANHEDLFRRWMSFAAHSERSTLPARARELLIMRVAWHCASHYEWAQHRVIGLDVGLTAEEVDRCTDGDLAGWEPDDELLLRAVDELCRGLTLSDATWTSLGERWAVEVILDVIFTTGLYVQVAMALRALRVQVEQPREDVR